MKTHSTFSLTLFSLRSTLCREVSGSELGGHSWLVLIKLSTGQSPSNNSEAFAYLNTSSSTEVMGAETILLRIYCWKRWQVLLGHLKPQLAEHTL